MWISRKVNVGSEVQYVIDLVALCHRNIPTCFIICWTCTAQHFGLFCLIVFYITNIQNELNNCFPKIIEYVIKVQRRRAGTFCYYETETI